MVGRDDEGDESAASDGSDLGSFEQSRHDGVGLADSGERVTHRSRGWAPFVVAAAGVLAVVSAFFGLVGRASPGYVAFWALLVGLLGFLGASFVQHATALRQTPGDRPLSFAVEASAFRSTWAGVGARLRSAGDFVFATGGYRMQRAVHDRSGDSPASPRLWRVGLLFVLLLGGGIRLSYVTFAISDNELRGDELYYSNAAQGLAEGRGFSKPFRFDDPSTPGADHPPLAQMVMAPAMVLAPDDAAGKTDADWGITAQRYTQALVGLVTIFALAQAGRRLLGDWAGLFAGFLTAIHPSIWVNDGLLMSEAEASATMALFLWCAAVVYDSPRLRNWGLLGASLGLAGLARGESLLNGPLIVVPLAVTVALAARMPKRAGKADGADGQDAARRAHVDQGTRASDARPRWFEALRVSAVPLAVAALAAIGVLAPWVTANLLRFDPPATLTVSDGILLIGANCPETWTGDASGMWTYNCVRHVDTDGDGIDNLAEGELRTPFETPEQSDAELNVAYRQEALAFWQENLSDFPRVAALRLGRLWGTYHPHQMVYYNGGEGREDWVSWWAWRAHLALLIPALIGARYLWIRRRPVWPFLGQAFVVSSVAVLFYGLARFRISWDLAVAVLAAAALEQLRLSWVRRAVTEFGRFAEEGGPKHRP